MMVYLGSRSNDKTVESLYNAFDFLIANWPESEPKITLYVVDTIYDYIKTLDGAHFRGRWLYVNYKGHEIFVKKVFVKEPEGFKTCKITRIKPEYLKELTKTTPATSKGETLFNINAKWTPVEWPNKEKK